MTKQIESNDVEPAKKRPAISLDAWAVALALLLSILVRAGLIKNIPW